MRSPVGPHGYDETANRATDFTLPLAVVIGIGAIVAGSVESDLAGRDSRRTLSV